MPSQDFKVQRHELYGENSVFIGNIAYMVGCLNFSGSQTLHMISLEQAYSQSYKINLSYCDIVSYRKIKM